MRMLHTGKAMRNITRPCRWDAAGLQSAAIELTGTMR
jgi:hypothetical protein